MWSLSPDIKSFQETAPAGKPLFVLLIKTSWIPANMSNINSNLRNRQNQMMCVSATF